MPVDPEPQPRKLLDFRPRRRDIPAMRKRVHISLAVLLVALAGVTVWQGLRLREPVYQGMRFGDWLAVYKLDGLPGVETWQVRVKQQKADEAVRHAGTNALPILLRMLRAHDSALKLKCMELAKRQHLIIIRYTPAEELNYRACSGFGVLGAKAQNAVPVLIEIANQNLSRASRWYAIQALVLVRSEEHTSELQSLMHLV